MHRRFTALLICATAFVALRPMLLACGDKFLIGARGTRIYRSTGGIGAAAILIDGRPGSQAAGVVINEDAAAVLRREGYTASVFTSATDLKHAMDERGWDLLIVDAADAQAMPSGGPGVAQPSVLPVLSKPTGAALSAARQQFTIVMKGPLKTQAFIDAVGDALDKRVKSLERAAKLGTPKR
jgi:hypothetical protein